MMPHRRLWDVKSYDKKAGTYTLFAERIFKSQFYTIFQKIIEESEYDPERLKDLICEFDASKYKSFLKKEAESGDIDPNPYSIAKAEEGMKEAQRLLYEEPYIKLPLLLGVKLFRFIVDFRLQKGK